MAVIAILLPCTMAGVRYGVGTDYYNYCYIYQRLAELTFAEYLQLEGSAEWAVYFISKIAALFDSPQLFFSLFAFFIYAPVVKMILEREEKNDTFFLALFFLLGSFSTGLNIMRQTAAASILLYSLKYVINRKFKNFVLSVVFISMFHISAIIILPIYFIWNRENKFTAYQFKSWIIVAAYCVVAINLPDILQIVGGHFAEYEVGETQGRNLSILLNCIWTVIFLLFNKQITKRSPQNGLYIFMVIIGAILSFTGMVNVYFKRCAMFFNYPDFILLTELIWLLSCGYQRYLGWINLSGAVMNILLNALLIPIWGAIGAATASVISQLFTNVVVGYVLFPLRQNNRLMIEAINPKLITELIFKRD